MQVLGIDLDQGDVGLLVGANNGSVELAVVIQGDFQLLGAADDMVVGDDVAVSADDYTRAHSRGLRLALLLRLLLARTLSLAEAGAEEEFKRVDEAALVVVLLGSGVALDAHHTVDGVLGHVGEVAAQVHGARCGTHQAVGRYIIVFIRQIGVGNHAFLLQLAGCHHGHARSQNRGSHKHNC